MKLIKNIIDEFNKTRYKKYNDYIFDRLIFNILLFGMLIYLFFVAWAYNFDIDYFSCVGNQGPIEKTFYPNNSYFSEYGDRTVPREYWGTSSAEYGQVSPTGEVEYPPSFFRGNCRNPFYKPPSWKNKEFLPVGEYGKKPGILFNTLTYVVVLCCAIAFILNHKIYNKGKLKDIIKKVDI